MTDKVRDENSLPPWGQLVVDSRPLGTHGSLPFGNGGSFTLTSGFDGDPPETRGRWLVLFSVQTCAHPGGAGAAGQWQLVRGELGVLSGRPELAWTRPAPPPGATEAPPGLRTSLDRVRGAKMQPPENTS